MKNYSLLIMGGSNDDEDVDDEHAGGGWSPPEVILATFPPSDLFRRQPSDSLFRCSVFLRRLLAKLLGGLFFGRSHEGGERVPHAARESGRVGPPNSLLGLPFSRILGSYVLFFMDHLIPNKWGNCELAPKIIIKHKYNPYMMQISWNIK